MLDNAWHPGHASRVIHAIATVQEGSVDSVDTEGFMAGSPSTIAPDSDSR